MRSSFVKEAVISHDETGQHRLPDQNLLTIFKQHTCFYVCNNCEFELNTKKSHYQLVLHKYYFVLKFSIFVVTM